MNMKKNFQNTVKKLKLRQLKKQNKALLEMNLELKKTIKIPN